MLQQAGKLCHAGGQHVNTQLPKALYLLRLLRLLCLLC
jgi:hypothetical protein